MNGVTQPLGDGSVTSEKLLALLALDSEHDDLDYKEYLDLSNTKDKVELVKDMAAMQSISTGGYIVVGVDGQGTPSTKHGALTEKDFDPANLHRIAENYLPTVLVRSAVHDVGGVLVAIIYVGPPNPPNIPILVKDGQYPGGKGTKTVFAAGDVFVRRGTQSVRWSPADVPMLLKPWEEAIREDERRRAGAYAQELLAGDRARAIAQGPLGALTWRLAADEFDAAFLEAMRAGDEMTLRKLFLTLTSDASALATADDQQELDLLLDRAIAALALAVTYNRADWTEQVVEVLVNLYRSCIDSRGHPHQTNGIVPQQMLWRIAVGVEGVGGLAVRLRALWAIPLLAEPSRSLIAQIGEPSWIRHALTAAANAYLLNMAPDADGRRREIGGPTVAVARQLVERISALRPDLAVEPFELNKSPADLDPALDSLIQFDVFWNILAATGGRQRNTYPSFASFFVHRADPALELLIRDPEARSTILGDDEDKLDHAMRIVVDVARQVSMGQRMWPWETESQVVQEFLREQ